MPDEKKTPCECSGPGWCVRHQCQKPEHFYHLCQTRMNYFQAWEEGRGPGQIKPSVDGVAQSEPRGLGDKVEAMLHKIGITEDRYKHVKELFGLPPTCGCARRKAWLNKVGRWWQGQGQQVDTNEKQR